VPLLHRAFEVESRKGADMVLAPFLISHNAMLCGVVLFSDGMKKCLRFCLVKGI
jgi:hypothetical protein